MKRSMKWWLALVLLEVAGVAARAQQGPQNHFSHSQPNQNGSNRSHYGQGQNQNQGGQPQNQDGQKQSGHLQNQSAQQAGNNPFDVYTTVFQNGSTNGQGNATDLYLGAFQSQYLPTLGNGGVWTDLMDLTAEMSVTPADDALRAQLGLPADEGLIVTSLAANAPASHAGVQQNDVLLKLGDASLAKAEDLEEGLKAASEKPVALTVLRGGKKLKIQVQPLVRVAMGPVRPEAPAFWIGVSVSPLEPALRAQLNLPQNHGLLAIGVVKDGPAAQADIKVHDILLTLDGKPLDSQEKLVELVQSHGEKSVPIALIRAGKPQTVIVTPQRRKPSGHRSGGHLRDQLFSYRFVRPGAIMNANPDSVWVVNPAAPTYYPYPTQGPQPSTDSAPAMKRLDDLDAEIKQLRKAIEELNKILRDRK